MSTFIYIQNVDCGLAPCVYHRVWSLALCKPAIRRKAKHGDVVIAVTPKNDGHRLSSWARIDQRIPTKLFFESFSELRPDNIYKPVGRTKFVRHSMVRHRQHSNLTDLTHDLGQNQESAFALTSKVFYSFGKDALTNEEWLAGRENLERVITKLGRAFQRYFDDDVIADLKNLERYLAKKHADRFRKSFVSRNPGLGLLCHKDSDIHSVCNSKKTKH